jgi:hypothetical protein
MKIKTSKRTNNPGDRATPSPDFVKRAERAFKKVATQVVAEHKRHGLKPLVWKS